MSTFGNELCNSRKYPFSPVPSTQMGLEFLVGGWVALEDQTIKKSMRLSWYFQRDREVIEKIASLGEVQIFSSTIHCANRMSCHLLRL